MNKFHNGVITTLGIVTLQACTSVPVENTQLIAVQMELKYAQATPEVSTMAGAEIRDAAATLDQARAAWAMQEKPSKVNHLAYLASKKIAIAQTMANQRLAENAINEAQGNRQKTLLAARTLDAENALRIAQSSQQIAAVATQQAKAAQGEIALARQDAESSEANADQLRARLSEMDARQTDRGMVVTIGDLLFDNNSAVLRPGAGQSVQRLGAFLKAYPMRNALIEGYTDSVGSTESNQGLSDRRAAAVKRALVATGVMSERMIMRGYGEAYPVGNNQSAEGRLSNRRVEVILSDDTGQTQAR